MKKLLLPVLLLSFLIGCSVPRQVSVGMTEEQFKKEHPRASVVELSKFRTVYRQEVYSTRDTTAKFYYFTNSKLVLMDEGYRSGRNSPAVPTP
jgi:predicted adenine nucleotide alpha hydrolase (AANH) superfamily ATPase